MANHDVVVIGASAGGLVPLKRILSQLPNDLPAHVFVALHLAPRPAKYLIDLLDESGPLPVKWAEDNEELKNGTVSVAPPDRHLILNSGRVRVLFGPRECGARPAIDVLFRSAAVGFASRVIGVVLSGRLDDGTRGLAAVKRCGGTAVVMDPAHADQPEMPRHALSGTKVDYCIAPEAIGPLIVELSEQQAVDGMVPDELLQENRIALGSMSGDTVPNWDDPPYFACPECGGALREFGSGEEVSFRCRLGHSYGTGSLLNSQQNQLEQALWIALRTLTDRKRVLDRLADDYRDKERSQLARFMSERAEEVGEHYRLIYDVLASLRRPESNAGEATPGPGQ